MSEDILKQENTGRIRTFQGARFLFVVLIYMSHCVTPRTLQPFDFGGEAGVSFFFMLSGFALSWGYGPGVSRGEFKPGRFFWRHFWRLYPLHLLLFAIMLALDIRAGHCYDWLQTATTLLLLQSWIPCNHTLYNINAVSWFLCDTIFFYAIFRWLYRLLTRGAGSRPSFKPAVKLAFLLFAVAYCIVAWRVPGDMVNCTLYVNPLLRAVDFGLGIAAYRLYKAGWPRGHGLPRAKVLLPAWAVVLWLLYNAYQALGGNGVRCAALFWPFMPLLIMSLASANVRRDPVAMLLASRPMVWLGGISFEFFMVHLLAMRLARHCFGFDATPEGDMLYFSVAFVMAVAMACVLHYWFVKPVGNAINRQFQRF